MVPFHLKFCFRSSWPQFWFLSSSATWWRLLGQKYLLTAEVTRLRLRGERLAVWCGNEIRASLPQTLQSEVSFSERWQDLQQQIPRRFHEIENRLLTHSHVIDDHARLINQTANGHE